MTISPKLRRSGHLLLRILPALIILTGIILRLILFFQNRNLIIDEANIVRNLAERGFAGLALPLRYEQYAPPVFLWIEELASLLFGYGEKSMRLYPLLSGIAALFVFYKVASKLMGRLALCLPLAFLSFGGIFVKYSVELKQYMPDVLISLLLILAALSWDRLKMRRSRFVLLWAIIGSLAIWSSMPSVFILAGIGFYYAWPLLRERRFRELGPLMIIALVWLAQFALYYELILKPQINSEYLQNYHRGYFLFATPANREEWLHNWTRLEVILKNVGGVSTVAIVTNLALMLVGGVTLLRRRMAQFFLVAFPVALVLVAAALNQFSLIERVVLFIMPLWMLLIGIGFDTLWRLPVYVKALLLVLGVFMARAQGNFSLFYEYFGFHEITEGMAWIQARGGRGDQLYVHDANVPTYIYYTELHPDRERWRPLFGAHRLTWQDNYSEVTAAIKDTAYFLYTGGFPDHSGGERERRTSEIATRMRQVDYFEKYICFVFVYVPRSDQDTASGVSSGTTPN